MFAKPIGGASPAKDCLLRLRAICQYMHIREHRRRINYCTFMRFANQTVAVNVDLLKFGVFGLMGRIPCQRKASSTYPDLSMNDARAARTGSYE